MHMVLRERIYMCISSISILMASITNYLAIMKWSITSFNYYVKNTSVKLRLHTSSRIKNEYL